LIEIINKQLLLQLVGYLCYWQMGFNSVFKGLSSEATRTAWLYVQSHKHTFCTSSAGATMCAAGAYRKGLGRK